MPSVNVWPPADGTDVSPSNVRYSSRVWDELLRKTRPVLGTPEPLPEFPVVSV